jgi:hypothetical protein
VIHPDSVAEKGTAAKGARGINGNHGDRHPFGSVDLHELINECRLPCPWCSCNPHDMRAPLSTAELRRCTPGRLITVLYAGDEPSQCAVILRAHARQQLFERKLHTLMVLAFKPLRQLDNFIEKAVDRRN